MPSTDWVKELGPQLIGANRPAEEASCDNVGVCEKLLKESRNSIFKVETEGSSGTGWVGPDGKLITDYHVITGASEITAIGQNGTRYKLAASKIDDINDLAALEFVDGTPESAKSLKLSTAKPEQGAYQAVLSHRWGNDLEISQGIFDNRSILSQDPSETPADRRHREKILDLSPATMVDELVEFYSRPLDAIHIGGDHGSSGAPVFDENGKVTSVMDLRLSERGLSYGTPSKFVQDLLAKNNRKFAIETGYETGFQSLVRELATESALGTAFDIAVPVLGAKALSQAAYLNSITNGGVIIGGAYLLYRGVSDYNEFRRGSNTRDNIANGMALAADAMMTAGYGSSLLLNADRFAAISMAAGMALRLGAEAIPNHYVTKSIKRADGSGRPATLDFVLNN